MLLDNFYSIRSYETSDLSLKAILEFVPAHPIFKGHFPTVPVVPGVCMMQMIKEVFEKTTGKKINFRKVPLMKFLIPINPLETATVQMDLSYSSIEDKGFQVNASLLKGDIVYFRFKGVATSVEKA